MVDIPGLLQVQRFRHRQPSRLGGPDLSGPRLPPVPPGPSAALVPSGTSPGRASAAASSTRGSPGRCGGAGAPGIPLGTGHRMAAARIAACCVHRPERFPAGVPFGGASGRPDRAATATAPFPHPALQVYLVYYFRDVVRVTDPIQAMSWVAVMALLGVPPRHSMLHTCARATMPSNTHTYTHAHAHTAHTDGPNAPYQVVFCQYVQHGRLVVQEESWLPSQAV